MNVLRNFWSQHERVWITDFKKDTQSLAETETIYWLPYQGPRDVKTFCVNLPRVIQIMRTEKPDLVVSTGASIAVSTAIAAKVLGLKFIFIESVTRAQNLSLSGQLVYPFADEFYVQWPELCKKYPRALFRGIAT